MVTAVPPKPRSRLAWSRVHLHVGESHRRCPTQRQAPGTGAEAEGGVAFHGVGALDSPQATFSPALALSPEQPAGEDLP